MSGEKQVSCIGLGLLGSAMTGRLIEHDWAVTGFDLVPERCDEFAAAGGRAVDSPADVVTGAPVLFSLPTSEISAEVVKCLKSHLSPGQIIIDTTTGHPEQIEQLGQELAEVGCFYLDATVGGSSQQAQDGDAIIMCGGDRAAFESCRALFNDLARQTFYLGPSGSGSRMKLVLNLVLGLNRAVLAEGLGLADRFGLDLPVVLEILKAGPSWSRAMDTKGKKMLTGDFTPQARLTQHLKDVRLMLETGKPLDARLPFSELHADVLQQLVDQGDGDLDNSAVIRAFLSGGFE